MNTHGLTMRSLAFEIGTEEIPAFDLHSATEQLDVLVARLFAEAAIPHGNLSVFSSPRRLIVVIEDIPEKTEEKHETFKGPSVKIAFDAQGNPTKAAEGFARGKGITTDSLIVQEVDGAQYVFAETFTPSVEVITLLPNVLKEVIKGISWSKSQRWGSETEYFSRPIRWLVALFGTEVVPFDFAGLSTGNLTYGHRIMAPGPFEVGSSDEMLSVVQSSFVVPSEDEREALIRKGVALAETQTGYRAVLPAKTLREVVNLCEYPTVLVGQFDEEFLAVPEEIIVDAMLMHQRYFPLYDANDRLTNSFLVVSNGNPEFSHTIIDGNERVVRARLFDAKFFYDEDLKKSLEAYVERLAEVVFQEQLGTMLDKTKRIEALGAHLSSQAGLDSGEAFAVSRAARLCKADLVTETVVEFTSVQGIMGAYYAHAQGEPDEVCTAIREHYQPRFAGDNLPSSVIGRMVACADKLDTICGLFAIGQGPTGSSDPFSLRRSAIGIINMLFDGLNVLLLKAVDVALSSYQDYQSLSFDYGAVKKEILDFFVVRTKVMLKDEGYRSDSLEAVLACGVMEPAEIARRVKALDKMRDEIPEAMQDLATAFARANNLKDASIGFNLYEEVLSQPEVVLLDAINEANNQVAKALSENHYEAALLALSHLRNPIDVFFDEVLIMDEDAQKRANRLALLNRFVAVFDHIADFSRLATK